MVYDHQEHITLGVNKMGVKNPIYDYSDGRYSVRLKKQEAKRKKARELARKMLGKNYFTNMQEVMLEPAIELSERKDNV